MSLLFMDGFAWATGDVLLKYTASLVAEVVTTPVRRTGTRCLRIDDSESRYIKKALDSSYDTIIVGFALLVSGIETGYGGGGFRFYDSSGNIQCLVRVNSDYAIQAYRGSFGTLLGTSDNNVITVNTYAYIEIKITCDDIAGAVEVRVDGNTVLNLTDVDTKNSSNAGINQFAFYGMYKKWTYFQDLYVCDTSGADNNDFLGDSQVDIIYPTGDGNYSQFTPLSGSNYENVDELDMDGDTSYNSSETQGHKDSFTYGDLTAIDNEICRGIQINTVAVKDGSDTREIKPFIRSGSTDYSQGSALTLGSSYSQSIEIVENNPADSAAWELADINSLEAGVEITT